MLGCCPSHEPELIESTFNSYVSSNPELKEKPICYESHEKWMQYVVACIFCNAPDRRESVVIEHCKDCTPKFRDQQISIGMCQQPETVFIRSDSNGALIGVPLMDMSSQHKVQRWEKAVMGVSGAVVSLPKPEILSSLIETLAIRRARSVGRPKKDATE